MPPAPIVDTGPRTTATSEAEGRLKVGVGSKGAKKKKLKEIIKATANTNKYV